MGESTVEDAFYTGKSQFISINLEVKFEIFLKQIHMRAKCGVSSNWPELCLCSHCVKIIYQLKLQKSNACGYSVQFKP